MQEILYTPAIHAFIVVNQILDKIRESHIGFVHLKKSFDNVNREIF